jgi:hypothetical protein
MTREKLNSFHFIGNFAVGRAKNGHSGPNVGDEHNETIRDTLEWC